MKLSARFRCVSTIGIRREGKGKWERRVPLTPEAVKELTKHTQVHIQPCTKRVFSSAEYEKAGALIKEDLSQADIILGIKEVPSDMLLAGKRYMFFSHTHKSQPHNMPMLKSILDKKITLMDYELLVNDKKERLVAFGKHAGYAGMINILHGLGIRLLNLGYNTPFVNIPRSHSFRELDQAKEHIHDAGKLISAAGIPKEYGPLVFTFTGSGNVSTAAQEIFKVLPHEYISVADLRDKFKSLSLNKVYGVLALPQDFIVDNQQKFDLNDYFKHGSTKYQSLFHERILPFTSVLVNGAFWDSRYPKLITNSQIQKLDEEKRNRLLAIADISCDISGPLEFMDHASTIDDPFFVFNPKTLKQQNGLEGHGVVVCSIDNLPAELPYEASLHFSKHLLPLIKDLVQDKSNNILTGAMISQEGKLVEPHTHLMKNIQTVGISSKKRVLLLGSGRVAAPLIDYLLKSGNIHITIASNMEEEARVLANGRSEISLKSLDVGDANSLRRLVSEHDLAVSLVPATFHPLVAKACIDAKRNMLTASYKSPELEALAADAKNAGITILNELGLDPGIDHLLAVRFIDEVKQAGGHITRFVSCCGGLPAPENSSNPLGYKFSWSPRGVLQATMNPARFMRDKSMFELGPGQTLDVAREVDLYKGFRFEELANRDSMKYVDVYGLDPQHLRTMFRGTLRYQGYSEVMRIFRDLGMLKTDHPVTAKTWRGLLKHVLDNSSDVKAALESHLADHDEAGKKRVISAFEWFGMFSEMPIANTKSPMDALCALLESRLQYGPGERDMVCLYHDFGITTADGNEESHLITMVEFGDPNGYSAMAKTVGVPAAIGAEMILTGQLTTNGVLIPTTRDIYEPILARLESEGFKFTQTQMKQ